MAETPPMAAVTLGGKGSSLSSSSIFSISSNHSQVRIDSSISNKPPPPSSSPSQSPLLKYQITFPKTLTLEESRASLTLLLTKLLLSNSLIRIEILDLICRTLNLAFNVCDSIVIDVTEEEKSLLDGCLLSCCLDGICAVLDYKSSFLSPVSEALAALSCEALNAKVTAFNLVDSGDGKCLKDESGVAGDLKVLLNGSKLVGKKEFRVVSDIPEIYGSFREAIRGFHLRARVMVNSGIRYGAGKAWETALTSLAVALRSLGEVCYSRVKLGIDSIGNADLTKLFGRNCCTNEKLRDAYKSTVEAALAEDYVSLAHTVNGMFDLVRGIVSWEMITGVGQLDEGELLPKSLVADGMKVEGNGGNVIVEKKNDKRKKVLGKGTAVILQFIKDKLSSVDEFATLQKLASDLLDPKVAISLEFKAKVKEIVESNESRRLPKLPKGTRDFAKEQMTVREKAFSIITEVFKRHGATALDTPVFELRETLMGKYGEDSKLIYDLADQGGELCSLRYDLTVPFARYVAMNSLTSFKRYQIAKVYRRDNPSKGRYREFYQCDFDIAGQYEKMAPDFEVVKILTELLDELNIGDYEVKLNHRKLLDGMLAISGVSSEKFRTICSSIDKLDKQSFDQVKREMVEEKGLSPEKADKIGTFVKERGPPLELLRKLKQENSEFLKNEGSIIALDELDILFKALEKSKCIDKIVFDLSLARGLDYYTGVIFECVFKGTTQVGSIAAGGRYDNLIGMFGSKEVPAIGVSLGIERVFAIMEQNQKDQNQVIRANETQVLVGVIGNDLTLAAELVSELWSAKIKAEYVLVKKIFKIFDRARVAGIPFAVIQGDEELKDKKVIVRDIIKEQDEKILRVEMIEKLQNILRDSA